MMEIAELENQVTTFNNAYNVGDTIEVYKEMGGNTFVDEIKHKATIMGGHTAVTWLKEKGSYNLTFVKGFAQPKNVDYTICKCEGKCENLDCSVIKCKKSNNKR